MVKKKRKLSRGDDTKRADDESSQAQPLMNAVSMPVFPTMGMMGTITDSNLHANVTEAPAQNVGEDD